MDKPVTSPPPLPTTVSAALATDPWQAPPVLAAPPNVPGYEILDTLGRGGMGVVYKARQTALDRIVALKMISAPEAGSTERERFRTEALAAARLKHPGIVQVHEVGEHDGRPFLVMEFVEGGSLAAKLRGKPVPPRQAAQLAETLARAVQAAHEAGIVHRDLKPANVLVTPKWELKVADFGLAKCLDSDQNHTQTGAVLGTPAYMAPEQAAGRSQQAGPAADLYALGAILYELLTGRPPFQGADKLELLRHVEQDPPVPPSRLVKVGKDLQTICLKCLEKRPGDRYASAAALADDLGRFLRVEPIAARPIGQLGRAWRWARRRPAVAGFMAAGVLLVALLPALVLLTGRLREKDTDLTASKAQSDEAKSELAETRREWRRNVEIQKARITAGWLVSPEQSAELLGNIKIPPDELRDDFWQAFDQMCRFDLNSVAPFGESVHYVTVSPNGRYLAAKAQQRGMTTWRKGQSGSYIDCHIRLFDLENRILRTVIPAKQFDAPVFSSDSCFLVFLEREPFTLRVIETRTGHAKGAWTGSVLPFAGSASIHVAPEARRLTYPSSIGGTYLAGFYILDVEAGKGAFTAARVDRGVLARGAFSPDGKIWAVLNGATFDEPRPLRLVDVDTGTVRELAGPKGRALALAFAPDSRAVAAVMGPSWVDRGKPAKPDELWTWDLTTGAGTLLGTWKAFKSDEECKVAFVARGHSVAVARELGSVSVFDRADAKERSKSPLGANFVVTNLQAFPDFGRPGSLAFAGDGSKLAAAGTDNRNRGGSQIRLLEPATGRLLSDLVPSGHGSVPRCFAFSPTSRLLATACANENTVRIWDVASGRQKHVLQHEMSVLDVAFSPDGCKVACVGWTGHDAELAVWDAKEGERIALFGPLKFKGPRVIRFSPDGLLLALAGGEHDSGAGSVILLDAGTGKKLTRITGHGTPIDAVAFDPMTRTLFTGAKNRVGATVRGGEVIAWDVGTGAKERTITSLLGEPMFLEVTGDGHTLVVASAEAGANGPIVQLQNIELHNNP